MRLLPSQQSAIVGIRNWLNTPEPSTIRDDYIFCKLEAPAGRGKSVTTALGVIPTLYKDGHHFEVVSTTHQANDSLFSTLVKVGNPYGVSVSTLHSLLGLVPSDGNSKSPIEVYNKRVGLESSTYWVTSPVDHTPMIIVVDEAFRIDKDMLNCMRVLRPKARFILIGDPYQTPPVGEDVSVIVGIGCPSYPLIERKRFEATKQIGDLVEAFYLAVKHHSDLYTDLIPTVTDGDIRVGDMSVVGKYLDQLISTGSPILSEDHLILAGTKTARDVFNNYIVGQRIRRKETPALEGESIIELATFGQVNTPRIRKMPNHHHLVENHELHLFGEVTSNKFGTELYLYPRKNIFVSETMKALWAYAKQNDVVIKAVSLNVVKTIHMAQGLTSTLVVIDVDSIFKWQKPDMRRRLFYTAASRSSRQLAFIHGASK